MSVGTGGAPELTSLPMRGGWGGYLPPLTLCGGAWVVSSGDTAGAVAGLGFVGLCICAATSLAAAVTATAARASEPSLLSMFASPDPHCSLASPALVRTDSGYWMTGQDGLPKTTYRTSVCFPVLGGACLFTPNPKAVNRLPGSFVVGGARRIVT